ncbi:hypothetical protein AB4037_33115 [Labrys sp. KB_33_2]|uniref:hypothetical protein n=1 Tax=unclassified Labrys (in: a-proteobacteria) TaxID=2688601 RepID=UPI003EB72CF1
MTKVKKLLCGIAIGVAAMPSFAYAGSRQVTVPRGKPYPLLAMGSYGAGTCEVFPVRDIRIASGPTHGVAQLVTVTTKLGKDTGVCAGTTTKAPVVVYKSAGAFTGVDHVTVTWMAPSHTDNVRFVPNQMEIEITVK